MTPRSFRQVWGALADLVCTSPARIVVWYEGELRRLRITYYPDTGRMRLSLWRGATCWEKCESYHWPEMSPAERAHRARAVLIAERDLRFPDRPIVAGRPIPGCRGRLRAVAVGARSAFVALAFALAFCAGCVDATSQAAVVTPVEVVPQPGAERCTTEGHVYVISATEAPWKAENGEWHATEMICTRCLKKVRV